MTLKYVKITAAPNYDTALAELKSYLLKYRDENNKPLDMSYDRSFRNYIDIRNSSLENIIEYLENQGWGVKRISKEPDFEVTKDNYKAYLVENGKDILTFKLDFYTKY